MKEAIILGATGFIGSTLLRELLKDPRYEKIKLFSRSRINIQHEKLEEHLVDLFKLKEQKELFKADEVFCCIGTTKSKTPDKETYRKIDRGIPVAAAQLCKENAIATFVVISALGANPESRIFYNRTKGEMESEVLKQKIRNTYILQPSLIAGDRKEKRFLENLAKSGMKILNFILQGPLKKYRSIDPESIARAMVFVANNAYPETKIESDEIKKIAVQ